MREPVTQHHGFSHSMGGICIKKRGWHTKVRILTHPNIIVGRDSYEFINSSMAYY